jgi:hypothetical protein
MRLRPPQPQEPGNFHGQQELPAVPPKTGMACTQTILT